MLKSRAIRLLYSTVVDRVAVLCVLEDLGGRGAAKGSGCENHEECPVTKKRVIEYGTHSYSAGCILAPTQVHF